MNYPKFKNITDEQVTFIIENKNKMTMEELSTATGVSHNQVYYIFVRLKIKKGKKELVHIGDKFGKLTVIEYMGRITDRVFGVCYWKCKCDCQPNRFVNVSTAALTKHKTKSCGCHRIDVISNGYKNISGVWFGQIVKNARTRNIEFYLSIEYLNNLLEKQNFKCALSGIPIKIHPGRRNKETTASLDRIDNTKGYIEGNVQFVCRDINYMKWKFKQENFIELCKKITQHQESLECQQKLVQLFGK